MSLNIIVKNGSGGRVSDSEVSESLAKRIDREQAAEKAGYRELCPIQPSGVSIFATIPNASLIDASRKLRGFQE